jgi:hypothetical protein
MPPGDLFLPVGIYKNAVKEYRLPPFITPGIWVFKVTVHWDDHFGRSHSMSIPELTFEVVP